MYKSQLKAPLTHPILAEAVQERSSSKRQLKIRWLKSGRIRDTAEEAQKDHYFKYKKKTDTIPERSHGFSVAKMREAQDVTASQSQTDIVK